MASAVWCTAPNTPVVFWKVSDETAAAAKHPKAENVFMSAIMPAPPDGSSPAIVRQTGGCVMFPILTDAVGSNCIQHACSAVRVVQSSNGGDPQRSGREH